MLEKLLFGVNNKGASPQRDKFLLTAYFLLMYIGIDIFFLFVNIFNPKGENIPILIGLAVSTGCLYLLRMGWRNTAILIQLIRTNAIAFVFISIDPDLTGNFFYYIVSGIGALALYGHEERFKGILFSSASLLLFYISMLRIDKFVPANPHFFLIMNFTIAYVMAFIIIYFLNKLTFFSQLREAEKKIQLEKVNSELDRFVYSVSHDLRAPLSSISGLIQLSEKSSDVKEIGEYLNLMKGRIDKLEQFIRDIMNFSRNARAEVNPEMVDVSAIVRETFETLRFVSGAEAVALEEKLPDSMTLMIDRTRFQIVLFNLISNAIQYRDPYKNPCFIRISGYYHVGNVVLQIQDNGVGIEAPHIPKVFNMFYRASGNSKGSGLGLYIVKETMEKLGGTISLHSTLGQGTEFTLVLPANLV